MPSLGGTRRRHSKQSSSSSTHKKAPPSVISTVSSASSNATLTPRAALSSSLRPSKRLDVKKEPAQHIDHQPGRSRSLDGPIKERIDVFAFMEPSREERSNDVGEGKDHGDNHSEEEELSAGESSKSSSPGIIAQPQLSPRYSDLEVRAIQDGVQHSWGRGSLHSDSGISVRSSSPDQTSPIMQHKLPTVFDEPADEQGSQDSYRMGRYKFHLTPEPAADHNSAFGHKHWPSLETNHSTCPEAYYAPSPPMLAQTDHDAGVELSEMSPRLPHHLFRGTSHQERQPKASTTGYEFLASHLHARSDTMLKPIYRKFETLNNRMLLFLQDEISEMEDQLKDLDDAIAHEEQNSMRKPASRRAEAKLPSQLQWHRSELVGRSFAKVEQYNRALTSYRNMVKSFEPASHADITAYRSWITEHVPIVESESAFLNKDSDLLCVSSSGPRSDFRSGTALETPVIVVAFGLLCTVIVFKMVPQILARLVISAMVGVACLCTLKPKVMDRTESVLHWRKAIATYAAVMGMLAIVVG